VLIDYIFYIIVSHILYIIVLHTLYIIVSHILYIIVLHTLYIIVSHIRGADPGYRGCNLCVWRDQGTPCRQNCKLLLLFITSTAVNKETPHCEKFHQFVRVHNLIQGSCKPYGEIYM